MCLYIKAILKLGLVEFAMKVVTPGFSIKKAPFVFPKAFNPFFLIVNFLDSTS
ncbi:hypothetical protein D3C75_639000 [compost metagenome]